MNWFDSGILLNFLYKIINFVILAWIIVWLVRKNDVLEKVFGGYQRGIKQEIERAEQMQSEAARIKDDIEQAANEAKRRAEDMVKNAKAQAEREKTSLLASAQAEAKRLSDAAQHNAQLEQARQLTALKQAVIERSVQHAEQLLLDELTAKDNRHLVERFLEELDEQHLRVS